MNEMLDDGDSGCAGGGVESGSSPEGDGVTIVRCFGQGVGGSVLVVSDISLWSRYVAKGSTR
jgi:hypothetical protein